MSATRTCTILAGLVAAGCGAGTEALAPAGKTMETIAVTSRSFPSGGRIPVDYTCDGANRSPGLTWSAPPAGTQTFAIIVEDPEAPGGTFTHWIAYELGADARSLPEGVDLASAGGAAGLNDFKRPGYAGPCPPQFEVHHYSFRVFALDAHLNSYLIPDQGQ